MGSLPQRLQVGTTTRADCDGHAPQACLLQVVLLALLLGGTKLTQGVPVLPASTGKTQALRLLCMLWQGTVPEVSRHTTMPCAVTGCCCVLCCAVLCLWCRHQEQEIPAATWKLTYMHCPALRGGRPRAQRLNIGRQLLLGPNVGSWGMGLIECDKPS